MDVINKHEIEEAQAIWGAGIVNIGRAYSQQQDYESVAKNHIDNLYNYDFGTVLFKPTKATEKQFRNDKDEALSYFVATNKKCTEDKGFAIQPWTKVRFENTGMILNGKTALAMGNYFFTDLDGNETKVEYTFGYVKDSAGNLRIELHHSSIPYS